MDGFTPISKAKLDLADGKAGIYQFTTANGNKYIGQSNNIARRLAEHGDRIKDGTTILFKEVKAVKGLDGRTSREIAEQLHIEKTIGQRVKTNVTNKSPHNLENKVNPIGQSRIHLIEQYGYLFL